MALKTLQNFYKSVVTTGLETGTGTCYVSVLPTPSTGYLVINPSNVTKREIVAYSGTGTDEGGSYVILTTRGVGGTTEQAHDVNEPVRLNLTAEYYAEIQDEVDDLQGQIDTLVLQNAPNASTTTRGIVLMATAPAEAGTAIVVGTNDPRLVPPTGQPDAFISVSTGAGDAGSGVVLNASGVLDRSFISLKQEFTSSGTWNKPAGGTWAFIEAWGAGGSGGVAFDTANNCAAKGGAGGQHKAMFIPLYMLGATETVTIGTGGVAVAATSENALSGNAGNDTVFGSVLTAKGGGAGTATKDGTTTGGAGGAGGTGGTTTYNTLLSEDGAASAGNATHAGAGGGLAVGGSGASDGAGGTSTYSGDGGAGDGAFYNGTSGNVTGGSGTAYGGGGGGAAMTITGSGTATSGAGGDGFLRITVF